MGRLAPEPEKCESCERTRMMVGTTQNKSLAVLACPHCDGARIIKLAKSNANSDS
jgi:hypothetical protein